MRTVIAIIAVLLAGAATADDVTVLVTGANRGLGLEFARQYAARGWRVIATAREPEQAAALKALADANPKVTIERLDVTDFAQVDALAAKYRGQPIDILVNNAGVTGDPLTTQVLGKIDYAVFDQVMHVNALAPLKLTEAFLPNIESGGQKKVITVSSSMGSIGKSFGTAYFYRSSKSATNMIMYSLSKDLKKKGITIGLVNPGATDTDMMAVFHGKVKLRDPAVAAADMIRNIDGLTLAETGAFLEYDGKTIPW
ncbi:MAG: SDR family oxidoreductase [Gammaproteobacteria bacterium]|jgi:NAD(P)-dependent dehydrogenase (short-subunit alcohol dehydrogenase family)|nr:SDR family oxidoreductase [Gammaproteobacteria bacterium]